MQPFKSLLALAAIAMLAGPPWAPASAAMVLQPPVELAAPGLSLAAGQAVTHFDGRWFGRAAEDACGQSWAMDIKVRSGKVTGRFWRGGVLYDVYGDVAADGTMTAARGGKSSREFGIAAPRFLQFDLVFLGDAAAGSYGVAGSGGSAGRMG